MRLVVDKTELAICQLPREVDLPAWALGSRDFLSVTYTKEELSVVCANSLVPEQIKKESGWCSIKVEGPLDKNN